LIDLEIHLDKNVDKVQEVEEDGVVQLPQLLLPVHVLPGVQLLDPLHNIQMTEMRVRHKAYENFALHCPVCQYRPMKAGYQIRIQTGSGFNRVSRPGSVFGIRIRIQEGKNDLQK
jgi:hypothetical protein